MQPFYQTLPCDNSKIVLACCDAAVVGFYLGLAIGQSEHVAALPLRRRFLVYLALPHRTCHPAQFSLRAFRLESSTQSHRMASSIL